MQVTNRVTTTSDLARLSRTRPDIKATLICGDQTQRDAIRRKKHARHAEG